MAVIGTVLVKRIVIDRGNFTASCLVMNAQRSKLYDCRTPLFGLLTLCTQPTIEMVSAILSFVPLGKDSCVPTPRLAKEQMHGFGRFGAVLTRCHYWAAA
jgi:hypothetical protein